MIKHRPGAETSDIMRCVQQSRCEEDLERLRAVAAEPDGFADGFVRIGSGIDGFGSTFHDTPQTGQICPDWLRNRRFRLGHVDMRRNSWFSRGPDSGPRHYAGKHVVFTRPRLWATSLWGKTHGFHEAQILGHVLMREKAWFSRGPDFGPRHIQHYAGSICVLVVCVYKGRWIANGFVYALPEIALPNHH